LAITSLYEFASSVSTTEYSLTDDSTTLQSRNSSGVYQLFMDLSNLSAGDQFTLTLYEKATSAGTQRKVEQWTFSGTQGQPIWASPSLILMYGWEFSLVCVAGSDRTISWSVRQVA
jgi:hypothetical protein